MVKKIGIWIMTDIFVDIPITPALILALAFNGFVVYAFNVGWI